MLFEGYSGADMCNLCKDAALGPIRSIRDIQSIKAEEVRPITCQDFRESLNNVRASVSPDDLEVYLKWNSQYGSCGVEKKSTDE